jgi:hypothetical protein
MIAMPYPTGLPAHCELDQILDGLGWTVRVDAATVMTATPLASPAAVTEPVRASRSTRCGLVWHHLNVQY